MNEATGTTLMAFLELLTGYLGHKTDVTWTAHAQIDSALRLEDWS